MSARAAASSRSSRASRRRSLSIGKFLNRTHRMVFTVPLQDEARADSPAVAVEKLDRPALNGWFAREGRDFPSCGGGVDVVAAAGLPQEDADRPAALSGELQPPRVDAR